MSKGSSVDIPSDYTVKVGGTGSTISVDADLDNIRVKELADATVNSNLAVTQPITVNSNLAVTQPIVTQSTSNVDLKLEPVKVSSDSSSAIDVKPLAIDSCQTLKLAPLPPITLEQPYSQHFGFTFMGVELWGFNLSGRSETLLHSPPRQKHFHAHVPGPCDCNDEPTRHSSPLASPVSRSGLRVRVK
jgi:hypothetical protein